MAFLVGLVLIQTKESILVTCSFLTQIRGRPPTQYLTMQKRKSVKKTNITQRHNQHPALIISVESYIKIFTSCVLYRVVYFIPLCIAQPQYRLRGRKRTWFGVSTESRCLRFRRWACPHSLDKSSQDYTQLFPVLGLTLPAFWWGCFEDKVSEP